MSSSTVEQIKERLDIVEVIGGYVELQKAGANYKAKCPFHNERTPSFTVSPARGSFYCFGCHAKGDIFSFIEQYEGADFKQALKQLADKAGVKLEREDQRRRSEYDRLYAALETARVYFSDNLLRSSDGIAYLKGRGVTDRTIKDWSLGLALPEWRALHSFLNEKKFTDEEIEKTGLVKTKEGSIGSRGSYGTSGYYDTFRHRITFPIFDQSGRTVGFTGRALSSDPNTPKYLNTPETILFNKSELLYGLHKAKGEIRRKDYAILVEGQMDLIMCHQAGYGNAVASSGTAFTSQHVEKLKKLSGRAIIAFDSDAAGTAAAEKAGRLALSAGMEVKIATLSAKDPADLIKENPKAWAEALKGAKHIIDFQIDTVLKGRDPREYGRGIREKVLPFVADIPSSLDQSYYVSLISRKTGIKEDAVWEDLKNVRSAAGAAETRVAERPAAYKAAFPFEKRIMGIVLWKPDMEGFRDRIVEIIGEDRFLSMKEDAAERTDEIVFETEAYYSEEAEGELLKRDAEELLLTLERKELADTIGKLQSELRMNEGDSSELLKMIQERSRRLEEVKHKLSSPSY